MKELMRALNTLSYLTQIYNIDTSLSLMFPSSTNLNAKNIIRLHIRNNP